MSDRKKFRQSEEAFRAIVENSPDVVARYDLEYRRTYVNPRMQQLLNKPMEEIIGFKPSEHTPLPQNIDFEALLERVAKEKVERHFITPYIMPNGDERWGDIRVIPEFNEKKEVMSILMIGKDLDTYVPPPKLQPHLFSSKE
jgi:PAS domain S-box-containing protein